MFFNLIHQPLLLLAFLISIVLAISIHEFSHSLAATLLGDRTSKYQGRLTINPLKHLDMLGALMLMFSGFGWGKPVPVNPYNLKYARFGEAIVSFAGPLSNFITMIFTGVVFRILLSSTAIGFESMIYIFLTIFLHTNLVLGIFNLIPLPPLDGSKILFAFLPNSLQMWRLQFESAGPMILLGLIIVDSVLNINIFGNVSGYIFNWILKIFELPFA